MSNIIYKYVRTKLGEFIFFPETIKHSDFKEYNLISAGFALFLNNKIMCHGSSVSLEISSKPEDSELATKLIYGG